MKTAIRLLIALAILLMSINITYAAPTVPLSKIQSTQHQMQQAIIRNFAG